MFIGMEIGEHIPVNSEMVAGLTAVLLKNLEAKFFWWESYLRELEETSGGRSPLLMSTTTVSSGLQSLPEGMSIKDFKWHCIIWILSFSIVPVN